jgi:hypothetical protein
MFNSEIRSSASAYRDALNPKLNLFWMFTPTVTLSPYVAHDGIFTLITTGLPLLSFGGLAAATVLLNAI